MKYSESFIKTRKNFSKEADSKNARYFERTCMVQKQMAGVYALLPLGLRVMRNIEKVIRAEMDGAGGQEIKMNVLQPRKLWDETGRFETLKDIFYKTKGHGQDEIGLGPSHEEQVVDIFRKNVSSYKELPISLYQINTKFRNEKRAKSGLLRGREFTMKDMYSFHTTDDDFIKYYDKMKTVYLNTFKRCGLDAKIVKSSGGVFSNLDSHEFQVLNDVGEDNVYCCECSEYKNEEIMVDGKADICKDCGTEIIVKKGIEVGNIFSLACKYTKAMSVDILDQNGKPLVPIMGCYGIGMERMMATIVEVLFDEEKNKMIWPKEISPFDIHLISLGQDVEASEVYNQLLETGASVLFDERDVSPGEKFADADLIGCGRKIIVSKKSLASGGIEYVDDYNGVKQIIGIDDLKKLI